MNNLAVLQALAFEPRKAFTELDVRPRFWWPLLLVVLASAAISAWYTAFVDLEWLTDLQLRSSALTQNMTSAEIERMARNATARQGVSAVFNFIATTLIVALLMLIMALYYSLAGKVSNVQRGFRHWLALVSWTSTPTFITLLASAVVLLTASSRQLTQSELQPLSLNALLLHREADAPGYSLFTSLNLAQLLSLYLAALGVRVWSGRSWLFSIIFTALPYALIYGIWAFFSLR